MKNSAIPIDTSPARADTSWRSTAELTTNMKIAASQLLTNKQKQDEMQTEGCLTSKELHTFHATLVELCYFYQSRDELVFSDFHFQLMTV